MIGAIIILVVICLHRRIELAVAIMKTASSFIGDTWTVMLVPLVMFLFTVAFISYWILSLIYLYSAG